MKIDLKTRQLIDKELSSFFHSIGTVFVNATLYHLALSQLPESEVWKQGDAITEEVIQGPQELDGPSQPGHWSEAHGLVDMREFLKE